MLIETLEEVTTLRLRVKEAAEFASAALQVALAKDPLALIYSVKFEPLGRHPINGNALNFVEQVNQSCSWLAALSAAEFLDERHAGVALRLAPDATMSQPLDIMSEPPGLFGAEVFAAVHPNNSRKLAKDLAKLQKRDFEQHRYAFYISPVFPETKLRRTIDGIEVWSLEWRA